MAILAEGQKAPLFSLPDKDGRMWNLADCLGRKVILYFYPKDNTPGCTKQACAFGELDRRWEEEMGEKRPVIVGISKDGSKSHQNFAAKYDLPFVLLSDTDAQVMQLYGVWQEKKNYGKTYMGAVRSTFVIDEQGVIQKAMEKVPAATNAQDVAAFLEA